MDADLISDLGRAINQYPQVCPLSNDAAEILHQRVAKCFGFSTTSSWWWAHMRLPTKSFAYGQSDSLTIIQSSLPSDTSEVFLFVTDDNPPPWPCLSGPIEDLILVLRDLRFVECFFVDASLTWILFDTHENVVIGSGDSLRMPT